MPNVRFRCRSCRGRLQISARKQGETHSCPKCGKPVVVPRVGTVGAEKKTSLSNVAPRVSAVHPWRAYLVVGALGTAAIVLALIVMTGAKPMQAAETAPLAEVVAAPQATPERDIPGDRSPVAQSGVIDLGTLETLLTATAGPCATVKPANAAPVSACAKPIVFSVAPEMKAAEAPAQPILPEPAQEHPFSMKRIRQLSDDDLRRQLFQTPVFGLDASNHKFLRTALPPQFTDQNPLDFVARTIRHDLASLPLRKGPDCRTGKDQAEHLHALSRKLRTHLDKAVPRDPENPQRAPIDPRPDPDVLRSRLESDGRHWKDPAAIPTLQQLLMAENEGNRLVLIDLLKAIPGREASRALAARALGELHPDIRTAAVKALAARPADEYAYLLISAFHYPWPAYAEHAAEAIVALELRDLVGELRGLLHAPDPRQPTLAIVASQKTPVVRELVRVNHLANCLLCHARSLQTTDFARGAVPLPGEAPPSSAAQYYDNSNGIFVRADVVYLKQDFSVAQPVINPGPWPSHQRFDYLVRTRPATAAEWDLAQAKTESPPPNPYRAAILFALNELANETPPLPRAPR